MGAGVAKTVSLEGQSLNNLFAADMHCEACSTSLKFFSRKRNCATCSRVHCSACLVREPDRSRSQRRCNKCRILAAPRFSKYDLMQLKAKDLREYLKEKRIPTIQCTEKQDLMDLMLRHFGNDNYQREQMEHDVMVEALRDKYLNEYGNQSVLVGAETSNGHATVDENDTDANIHADNAQSSYIPPQPESSDSAQVPNEEVSSTFQPSDHSKEPSISEKYKNIRYLKEVTEIDIVEFLSVKQLKTILTNNFVDYKGCCEKSELIGKTKRLWRENAINKRKDIEDEEDEDVCKICMNAAIDCVLLECGHMISCTECGKRLSECPICRQYVVRAVHIFRS